MLEERLRDEQDSSGFWAADVKAYIRLVRQTLASEAPCVPLDLMEGRTVSEARELSQQLVARFGELLYWWPEMVEAARTLCAHGSRLAQPL